jgi:outer membrane protein TolC
MPARTHSHIISFTFLFWLLAASGSMAEENTAAKLPDTLTLGYALSLSDNNHPDNVIASSRLLAAKARQKSIEGASGFQTTLSGRLRWVEPENNIIDDGNDDNMIALTARKRLFDFGQSEDSVSAAKAGVDAQELKVINYRAQRRIDIMQAFFNVILADLAYARDNELMAIKYVRFDRAQDRHRLGQIAAVELLNAENEYHVTRTVRYASDVRRRATRATLANILNHPGELPTNLVRPELDVFDREIPEIEDLQTQVLETNPAIQALRFDLLASQKKVASARARKKPTVDLELQAADHSRYSRNNYRYQAGLLFEVPLGTSGAIDADIAEQRALMTAASAALIKAEMNARQRVLELWQELYVLNARRDEAKVFSEYRDTALDRDRGLYELDVSADLGDSLALYSQANYQRAKADYDFAIAWAELDAILGKPVNVQKQQTSTDKK